jgi:hypothetical protein
MAVAAVIVALLAVFGVLTIGVVKARRPIDGRVTTSFEAVARRTGTPLGCRKTTVDFYDCSTRLRTPRRLRGMEVHFKLWLRDDGCWGAPAILRIAASARPRALQGCLATG